MTSPSTKRNMIRITPPACTSCGGRASYESERFPSVRLCTVCQSLIQHWLITNDLADGNPLFFELAVPANESQPIQILKDGSKWLAVMGPSKYDSRAASQYYFRIESENEETA